jgi:hypothetical protein
LSYRPSWGLSSQVYEISRLYGCVCMCPLQLQSFDQISRNLVCSLWQVYPCLSSVFFKVDRILRNSVRNSFHFKALLSVCKNTLIDVWFCEVRGPRRNYYCRLYMYVCMYVCVYVLCTYVCIYVCTYARTRMYVCMYIILLY